VTTRTGKVIPGLLAALVACLALARNAGAQPSPADNAWLEIDRAGFEHNLQLLRDNVLTGGARICAVMKSDAYGHGVALLVPSLVAAHVEAICFTNNQEAKAARAAGFRQRLIRIRTAVEEEVVAALSMDVEETAGSYEAMSILSSVGQRHRRTINIHLELNSAGMGRSGLELEGDEGQLEVMKIFQLPKLKVVGIMTHFPGGDRATRELGLEKFLRQAAWVIDAGKLDRGKLVLHAANSGTAVDLPASQLDMVRIGSLLYGQEEDVPGLSTIMTLKSRVSSVQHYPKGSKISYGGTFTLARDSRIAVVPIGYSDGYSPAFSNRTQVLIRGRRHPVVGRVTMNATMVDVTDAPTVKAGDEVVLLGKQGSHEITVSELVAASYSNFAELFVALGNSNPKVLKKGPAGVAVAAPAR
jgi:alanine racemase